MGSSYPPFFEAFIFKSRQNVNGEIIGRKFFTESKRFVIDKFLTRRPLSDGNDDGGRYHIETSPLIFGANQWTCFYMITASVMKELSKFGFTHKIEMKRKFANIERKVT